MRVIILFALVVSTTLLADHNISVTVDGLNYQCSGTGSGTTTDPNCMPTLADWCDKNTSFTGTQCYQKANSACANKGPKFAPCVTANADYCDKNTSLTTSQCFDSALSACSGEVDAMLRLMDSVRQKR